MILLSYIVIYKTPILSSLPESVTESPRDEQVLVKALSAT